MYIHIVYLPNLISIPIYGLHAAVYRVICGNLITNMIDGIRIRNCWKGIRSEREPLQKRL